MRIVIALGAAVLAFAAAFAAGRATRSDAGSGARGLEPAAAAAQPRIGGLAATAALPALRHEAKRRAAGTGSSAPASAPAPASSSPSPSASPPATAPAAPAPRPAPAPAPHTGGGGGPIGGGSG